MKKIVKQGTTPSEARVRRLPRNEVGNDYLVGDIHGAYDLLLEAMRSAGFDRINDRLLVVGDLIDRGPGSARCLAFLEQPYVYAIAGNHECILVDLWLESGGSLEPEVIQALASLNFNGMGWMKNADIDHLNKIAERFEALPYVLEVETERGMIGLVHADVPYRMDWQTFADRIRAGDAHATGMATGMCEEARNRVQSERDDGVVGIGRVFVGHTPQFGGIRRLGNVFYADSGAVFGEIGKDYGHLSMVNPIMATADLVAPLEARPPKLIDLRTADKVPSHSFTNFCAAPSSTH